MDYNRLLNEITWNGLKISTSFSPLKISHSLDKDIFVPEVHCQHLFYHYKLAFDFFNTFIKYEVFLK